MNHKQIIKKTGIKRLYVALAALLFAVFTIGAIPTHAQSVENGDFDLPIMLSGQMALLNNDENETSITVNGTAAQISDFSFTNAVEVTYGDTPTLALSGSTTADSFLYLAAAGADTSDLSSETWSELSSGAVTLIPGNYYLGYVATVDGQQVSDTSGQFGFTVTKGRLHQPTNLSWTAGAAIANWNPVTTSTSNAPLTSGAVGGYTVALYRGSTLLDTETLASTANSFDFATYFTTAGSYHFTVRANVATAMANRYTSSVDTLADGAYTYAVSVTVSGQYGIASVQPELVTLALKGEPLELRATVEDGLTFDSWACEETTLDFTDATSANTTVTLPDNYSGDYALTITANAVDAIAPTISNFGAGTGNQLTATVTDTGLGLATYAFSTQSSWAQVLQSEKHTTSGLTGTYTFTLENNNIY